MRATALAVFLTACAPAAVPSSSGCTYDGEVATCAATHDGAGFLVTVHGPRADLEYDGVNFAAGSEAFPGTDMLEYTAAGTTCDATDGTASWADDGNKWCMRTQSTCSGYHVICIPLAQFYK